MINHWIGGSPLCEEKNDHEKWHTRHSQSCRSACSSTSSRTIGSLRGKLRQQKKATRHRCVWMDLHFLYPQVWSFEYEKWSWTSGRNGYTYLSCESSSAGKDTSSISKILSCKEATKDHQSTAKSKIQRSDRASLADKALQSLQGLRRRHPSEHSSCGGETWNHVETIHFSSGPSFFDQSWSKSLFFGMGVWVKMIDPAFCDGLRSQKWPRAISQSRQPHFPWPWLHLTPLQPLPRPSAASSHPWPAIPVSRFVSEMHPWPGTEPGWRVFRGEIWSLTTPMFVARTWRQLQNKNRYYHG